MRQESGRPFYAADLAYVHDAGFLAFARRAAPAVLTTLRRHCPLGGRIVEIGCGSGGLTRYLTGAGFRVVAVDISRAMIRLARKRAPRAKFRVASYYDFTPPKCEAVVAVGECLNYMADGSRQHVAVLRRLFRRAAAALPPGGLLLFDFLEPFGGRPRCRNVDVFGSDWVTLVAIGEDWARRSLTRHITTIRRIGGRQRLSVEVHRQCLLRRREVEEALQTAGFRVRFRPGYGRSRLKPGQVVVEAVRREG